MCSEHPGLIVRHHDFENFPTGTTPHTTAPLDYLIVALSTVLRPFTPCALDLAGTFISPLLALLGGWFLWWWSRRMGFRYRWLILILYAISRIVVHGTELGRPDHQSLLILLLTVAICAEWSLRQSGDMVDRDRRKWSIVSGVAWGLAIWTSAYESLVLFSLVMVVSAWEDSKAISARCRRPGWFCFVVIIMIALLVERRVPSFSIAYPNPLFRNWAHTIGELAHISPANPIWLFWCGYLILITPLLIWFSVARTRHKRESIAPTFVLVLLIATYLLTIWQARWGYFFVLVFALVLPRLLERIQSRAAVWIAFFLSILPILRDWDQTLWPNEAEVALRLEQRNESVQLRDIALSIRSSEIRPFLAPWWLSPSIAYWSRQPGIAGSSHESLDGIADSARFFFATDLEKALRILENHQIAWVFAYDSERVAQTSGILLGEAMPAQPLCLLLDRFPARGPWFLIFSAQNGGFKLYRTVLER